MARHTIQVPINKSGNTKIDYQWTYWRQVLEDNEYRYFDVQDLEANAVSDKLYCVTLRQAGAPVTRMGLAWDGSLVPKNKIIVSAKLYIYSITGHSRPVYYKFGGFSEGSAIQSHLPADGSQSGGMPVGWGYINIGELKGDSLIVGAGLQVVTEELGSQHYSYKYEYWESRSHRSATNKPYLEIVYDDVPPEKPRSLYPSQTTQSTRDIIRFSWLHNSSEELLQKGFTLQYSLNSGSTWTNISQTTPNQFYDMPANTLPTGGAVIWRVRTTDDNDEVSEYESASFNLGISPQQAPVIIAPISQYVDKTKPVKFEWSFIGGNTGDMQSKFDLEYSANGGLSWTTVMETSTNTYYELAANTFSNGNIIWRVRTYSNWNEVSPYSENKSFTVIGSPAIPLIVEVSNSAKPVITWDTTEQRIYELQILQRSVVIYNTGFVPSISDRAFKVPIYLQDGNYTVKLRIFNEYNMSSNWSEKSFTVSTIKPQIPEINIFSQEYKVTIKTSNASEKTLIYRDDILIGLVTDSSFVDYTGENKRYYKYFARAVDANDNFADSEFKVARCNFSGNTIVLASNPKDFLKLQYGLDSMLGKTSSINAQGNLIYYDGRTYPVAEYTEFKSKSKALSLVLENRQELDKLISMIESKEILLYRDADGENIHGVVFNLDYDKTILGYYQIKFTITEVDEKGVAYD